MCMCNFGADHSAKAHALMNALLALLEATTVQRHALQRGELRPVPESLFHEFDPYRSPCSPGARHAAGRWPWERMP